MICKPLRLDKCRVEKKMRRKAQSERLTCAEVHRLNAERGSRRAG